MPGIAFDQNAVIVLLETLGTQSNRLIHAHMPPDHGGFADDYAGAVVDKKTLADFRAGMNIDTGG